MRLVRIPASAYAQQGVYVNPELVRMLRPAGPGQSTVVFDDKHSVVVNADPRVVATMLQQSEEGG
jgi:hypothetical protein